ncbi:MAG: sigma-54-dependent Fis family transcriptional regulator [Candidatus Marinimicrobia bacterium]|nr:sigma-54-dependent Fis family transcriptional regulator [Candidatus Neomarinimicrobiota bacterium]
MQTDKIRKSVGIIGKSSLIEEMLVLISQIADTDISVLVTGSSGSGKEMVAKAIHKNSRRKFRELITVNCAAIPSGIIESELFGHKKGSFTGATENRKGYFESADKGTIFLDEIGELPLETQAKLLRVIEQGEFLRVGEAKSKKVDVRIIAATNKDLSSEVDKNNFRQDLYYRLKTINIRVPDLKNHLEDLDDLIDRFSLQFTARNSISYKGFSAEAILLMKNYSWPGNIRELKNVVESILVINKGSRVTRDMVCSQINLDEYNSSSKSLPLKLDSDSDKLERELILKQLLYLRQDVNDIKQMFLNSKGLDDVYQNSVNSNTYFLPKESNFDNMKNENKEIDDAKAFALQDDSVGQVTMQDIEGEIIERTLRKMEGNRRKAAAVLDISERTLYRKIKEYGIEE